MRTNNLSFAFCLLLLASCGKEKSKDDRPNDKLGLIDPSSLPEQALSIEGTQWPSFMTVPWELRCEGLENVFHTYQSKHLPEFSFSVVKDGCERSPSIRDREVLKYRFDLTKGDSVFHFSAELIGGSVLPENGTVILWQNASSWETVKYSRDLVNMNVNFKQLGKTFDTWYRKDKTEATIFGRSYSQYLAEVAAYFGKPEGGLLMREPNLQIKLTQDPLAAYRGTAYFVNADSKLLQTERGGLLGCSDLVCLNSKAVSYSINGNRITLERPIETKDGVTSSATWFLLLSQWPLASAGQ